MCFGGDYLRKGYCESESVSLGLDSCYITCWSKSIASLSLFRAHTVCMCQQHYSPACPLSHDEAKKSITTDWPDLLPVAAGMNLDNAKKFQRIRNALGAGSEVAINLDQDVNVQERLIIKQSANHY